MNGGTDPEFSWQEVVVAGIKALDELSHRIADALAGARTNANAWLDAAQPVLEGIGKAALEFRDAYDEGVPSGWQALDTRQMLHVIDLMEQTGWCLTTTPPAGTLSKLLGAPDRTSQGRILLAAEAQILVDLDLELRAADDGRLPMFTAAARQAWDAQASGLFIASQALSSVSLSALSDRRGPLRMRNLGSARNLLMQLNIEDAGVREIRFVAVARAVGTALDNFPHDGPEPDLFNRHASAHGLSTSQYTQLNSLTALMLFCGWLREILWLMRIAQEDAEIPKASQ
jgi:hypothetical protein